MKPLSELRFSGNSDALDMNKVKAFESEVGALLPAEYIEFLRFSNGGNPEFDAFFAKNDDGGERWSAGTFYHLMQTPDDMDDLLWAYRNYRDVIGQKIIPIAYDGFGNQICLDLKMSGRVVLWIHDDEDAPLLEVADSFEEFIDNLHLNPDYI